VLFKSGLGKTESWKLPDLLVWLQHKSVGQRMGFWTYPRSGGAERKAKQQLPQTADKDKIDLNPDKTSVMRKHLLIHFRSLVLTDSLCVDTHQTRW